MQSQRGYITLLLLILILFGFFLSGGFILLGQQSTTQGGTKYVLVNKASYPKFSTLQLQTLTFIPGACDPGYLSSGEPDILYGVYPNPTQISGSPDRIKIWYLDEQALTLGYGSVSPMTKSPVDHVISPNVGDITARDSFGFPYFPALFITDVTFNPNPGDAVHNGTPIPPNDVYGSWKAANTQNPQRNYRTLPSGADPFPSQPTVQHSTGSNPDADKLYYGAEIIWNVSSLNLQSGHSYQVQFVLHDGDNNKTGGDIGIGCTTIVM